MCVFSLSHSWVAILPRCPMDAEESFHTIQKFVLNTLIENAVPCPLEAPRGIAVRP